MRKHFQWASTWDFTSLHDDLSARKKLALRAIQVGADTLLSFKKLFLRKKKGAGGEELRKGEGGGKVQGRGGTDFILRNSSVCRLEIKKRVSEKEQEKSRRVQAASRSPARWND